MIIKLTNRGAGNVKKAIEYVFQERNNKGEKREEVELLYGNPDELVALANSWDFKQKVRKLQYFSGVLALAEGERLTKGQIQFLISNFGKVLNNAGQTDIPFIVVKHVENNKEHYHFIGLRYDLNTMSFHNPFRPGWQRKWIPWAKLMEDCLKLKKVERKRDWIERIYYDLQLLCSRNPRLAKHLEVKSKALELAFLIKNFNFNIEGVNNDDERLKRILSRANRPYTQYCPATDPKEIRRLIQTEMGRDRKRNEKYRAAQSIASNEYVIERLDYPVNYNVDDNDKRIKGEVKMEKVMEKAKNSKEELEIFKKIDLVGFWTNNGGEVLERSSKNSIRIKWNNEKFLVSRNNNGHWLFQGIDDESKRGSIIDLCNLMGIKNLGEIRKKLRLYLNFRPEKQEKELSEKEEEVKVNWKERVREVAFNELVNHEVWSERGINPHRLDMFLRNVYADRNNNLCFPMTDENGQIIGYEVKGKKGFKMNLGSKGLTLIGDNTLLNERIVITESAFDALAYEQLRPQPKKYFDTLYVSTSGQLTERQLQQIRKLVEYKKIGALREVTIAFDNDEQGRKYAERLKQYLKDIDIQVKEHYSSQKDWNDELKKQKGEEIKWQQRKERASRYLLQR